jgi:hypothetical protein
MKAALLQVAPVQSHAPAPQAFEAVRASVLNASPSAAPSPIHRRGIDTAKSARCLRTLRRKTWRHSGSKKDVPKRRGRREWPHWHGGHNRGTRTPVKGLDRRWRRPPAALDREHLPQASASMPTTPQTASPAPVIIGTWKSW